MAHRYFTTHIEGERASITGEDAAHLARVLRAKPGQALVLCDGAGFDYDAEILTASREEVTAAILAKRPSAAEPSVWAEAYIGYAKGERMDFAVQKAVELGASAIYPFFSQNTVVDPAGWAPKKAADKTARLARIAAEAAKQAGRGMLPTVGAPLPFQEAVRQAAGAECPLFLYERGGQPLRSVVQQPKTLSIVTGAEGGFTPEEAAFAAEAGCVTVGLGPRILRCETAPAAVLAAVMVLTGNLE